MQSSYAKTPAFKTERCRSHDAQGSFLSSLKQICRIRRSIDGDAKGFGDLHNGHNGFKAGLCA
jgi:hypothetical protein